MPRSTFDNLSDFLAPARFEYREEICRLAAEAIAECNGDREAIDEWLHESIDSHEWVIYTFKAQFVALVCECDAFDALYDATGSGFGSRESLAYRAMLTDARAAVDRQLAERGAA